MKTVACRVLATLAGSLQNNYAGGLILNCFTLSCSRCRAIKMIWALLEELLSAVGEDKTLVVPLHLTSSVHLC